MVQAARSGRQNIAEGSRASGTSSQTELRLVNVARTSLDELLLDYEDYLRQHHLEQWPLDHQYSKDVRSIGRTLPNYSLPSRAERPDQTDPSVEIPRLDYQPYSSWLEHIDSSIVANTVICLIHQANYLLDHQIQRLQRQFVEEGGYSVKLATQRLKYRASCKPTDQSNKQTDQSDQTDPSEIIPKCPKCGILMVLRTAHQGSHNGAQFWGCSQYPQCNSTQPLNRR